MLSAVKKFPMPENLSLSDIRSFFGLVNQLALLVASSSVMATFRDALKPSKAIGRRVYWDTNLQSAFDKAKLEICNVVSTGLAYYDTTKDTAVVTDWSREGLGFVILQKHCECTLEDLPLCCDSGWKLVFCNYASIEGEALAVTWALKKARMFLQGCHKFHIVVDHQPLVKIFGNKCRNDIDNHLFQTFKERTL